MTVEIEIIAVGNEILQGDVLDSNSHWLCRQFAGLGAMVRRVTQLPDLAAVSIGTVVGATISGMVYWVQNQAASRVDIESLWKARKG